MATSYKDLQAQIAQLQAQAEEQRKSEMTAAIEQIRTIIRDAGLSERDLGGLFKGAKAGGKPLGKVAPKYADPDTGATWSGRGLPPKWIAPAYKAGTHHKFLIDQASSPAPAKKTSAGSAAKKTKRSR